MDNQSSTTDIRPTTLLTRYLLLAASLLVLVVFVNLFFLADQTDKYFAWTINPPLTAAFIGAGYGASFVLEFLAYRKRTWKESRLALYGVIAFSFLMLLATVMHRDRFHFEAPNWYTEVGTWFWLAIYASVPLLMSAAAYDQWQQAGGDPISQNPISRPIRFFYFLHSLLAIQVGVLLFVAPEQTATLWPWALTPLTGRAIGAWLVGIGVTMIECAKAADWEWVGPAILSYSAFVIFVIIAVLRYSSSIEWDTIQIWLFWVFWLAPMLANGYGWFIERRRAA